MNRASATGGATWSGQTARPNEPMNGSGGKFHRRNFAVLSILMPAFNAATWLSTTLDSLLVQQGEDFEVIICDDNSTDQTRVIARNYEKRDPRVRYIWQKKSGASTARNTAFIAARGRWVIYFDADDIMYPGSFTALMQMARLHPEDIVYCRWSTLGQDPTSRNTVPAVMAHFRGDMAGWLWIERAFLYDYPTYPGCFVLPRSLVEKAGGWNEQLSFQDDMEFYSRIICQAEAIRFCPEALFIYRQGVPGSLSNTGGRCSIESQYLATTLAVQHLLRVRDTWSARRAAVRQIMLLSYAQYLAAPDISRKAELLANSVARGLLWRPWLPGGNARRVMQVALGWKLALRTHSALKRHSERRHSC
jgi:hypothetical protein